MPAPLPPIDHVARALLVQGAREHALALLEAQARRPGPDRARCEALLAAVRARPHDRPTGPLVKLDALLAESLASNGLLVEARAVARGGKIASSGGMEIASALEQVLEDPPPSVPEIQRRRWAEVGSGSLSALEAIERDGAMDPWVRGRASNAARLLRGFSVHAPTAAGSANEEALPPVPEAVRVALAEKIAAHDLPGALALARATPPGAPGIPELVAILARIVVATERLMEEQSALKGTSTVPLGGHGLALFQLRMGNLADAERAFRRLVLEQAADHLARERLADVSALRRAIETSSAPLVAPEPSTVLDKRKTKPTGQGWASGAKQGSSPKISLEWEEETTTNVIRPEQEAELLLRSGRPERALEIYKQLLSMNPDKPGVAARVSEIESMLDEGRPPLPDEATVRRDVASIRTGSEARASHVEVIPMAEPEPHPPIDPDEDTGSGLGELPMLETLVSPQRPKREDDTPLEVPLEAPGIDDVALEESGPVPQSDLVTVHKIVKLE